MDVRNLLDAHLVEGELLRRAVTPDVADHVTATGLGSDPLNLAPAVGDASAAGAALPEDRVIDGVNVLPLTRLGGDQDWQRQTLFWQSGHYRVVRHGDWKLQVTARPDAVWLFDLAADPTEQLNLADARPDKVDELRELLEEHHRTARPPLYPSVAEMAIAVDKDLSQPFEDGDEYIYWPN